MSASKQQSVGRKKIEIKKIESRSNLQVSFSKRRTGLFKKAGELCVLCGAEIAIIVGSPGQKVFAFGHPSVDATVHRYLTGSAGSSSSASAAVSSCIPSYNRSYAEACRELEEKRAAALPQVKAEAELWWERSMDGMGLEEMEQFSASLKELKRNVEKRLLELKTGEEEEDAKSSVQPLQLPQPAAAAYDDGETLNRICFGAYRSAAGDPAGAGLSFGRWQQK